MMKIFFTMVLATALSLSVRAQNDVDALRYSMLDYGGTARSLGSGNAYGAVGGDFSSLSMNPAGLGIYRSGEFVFTPGLLSIDAKSNYYGQSATDNKYNFNISNLGLVFAKVNPGKENATDSWVGGGFAIGYNRLANYNSVTYYSGYNDRSSLLNTYVDFLNSGNYGPSEVSDSDPFGAGLAYETYLINPTPFDSTEYYAEIFDGRVQQTKSIVTEGGYDEFVISFAGNFANKLYIGGTIGIPNIHYQSQSIYTETDINDEHANFSSFTLNDITETSGIGINGKFGLIYRVNDYLRFGAAVHTPSLIAMNDNYYSSMSSQLDTSGNYSFDSPYGEYSYQLITPWRVIGSAALTFKNIGMLSADYEFVDYSEASFNFNRSLDAGDFSYENTVNNTIDEKYGAVSIIRLGGELMYDVFRFRGGYVMSGSPFNEGIAADNADLAKNTITAGIGIKEKSYFIDFGYARSTVKEYDIQYVYDDGAGVNQGATIDKTLNNFLLSFGFRF